MALKKSETTNKSVKKKKKNKNEIHLPNRFLYGLAISVIKPIFTKRYNLCIDKAGMEAIEGPCLVLSNHCSRMDWIFVGVSLWRRMLNIVITRYYYSQPQLRLLLKTVGAIPKDQFCPDVAAVKSIMSVAKKGGNIMLFPEGRTTPSGRSETFERSVVKLIRHLKMPVAAMHMNGAYFTYPKWAHDFRRGRVDIRLKPILMPQELELMDDEQIFKRITDFMRSDEFAWQKKARVAYHSDKMAEGLHNVLYICPRCGQKYTTTTHGDTIRCEACGNSARLNEYYDFLPDEGSVIPENISDWYDMQKAQERELIDSDADVFMTDSAVMMRVTGSKKWLEPAGKGTIRADRSGFSYTGEKDGQPFELHIPLVALPAVAYTPGISIEMYYQGEFYSFEPDNGHGCQRWSMFIELLHEKYCGR